ncbi:MAG: hypothetical protein ABJC26_09590, partial [Gemmatimonadaceae bacterium]
MRSLTTSPLMEVAEQERASATAFVEGLLPCEARISVYLFQPLRRPELLEDSPGTLYDVGPVPASAAAVERDLLFTCAKAGRTGSFLQSADHCLSRTQQTAEIDQAAARDFRRRNAPRDIREAQIAVESARYGFQAESRDGPPIGRFIHHLALAPSVHSFEVLATRRIPVLGTVFTLTRSNDAEELKAVREYSNLVDYAMFIGKELLDIRATHLLGGRQGQADFIGVALQKLSRDPTCDQSVQLVMKLLLAHHWFYPYGPVAYSLLRRVSGSDEKACELYEAHGWAPPPTPLAPSADDRFARQHVIADIVTLVQHLSWYRLGKEFRRTPEEVTGGVTRAVNTALLLLCGVPENVASLRSWHSTTSRTPSRVLAPSSALSELEGKEGLLAPTFPIDGIRNLVRGKASELVEMRNGSNTICMKPAVLQRFQSAWTVCAPGASIFDTRTHLIPS